MLHGPAPADYPIDFTLSCCKTPPTPAMGGGRRRFAARKCEIDRVIRRSGSVEHSAARSQPVHSRLQSASHGWLFAHGVPADLAERDPLGQRWTAVTARCAVSSPVRDSTGVRRRPTTCLLYTS